MDRRPPDALLLPEAWKRGETQIERIDSILAIAEPLLQVDRSKGQRAYIRRREGGWLFVTADPLDTENYPCWHSKAEQPRYRWVLAGDSSKHGFLVEEPNHA